MSRDLKVDTDFCTTPLPHHTFFFFFLVKMTSVGNGSSAICTNAHQYSAIVGLRGLHPRGSGLKFLEAGWVALSCRDICSPVFCTSIHLSFSLPRFPFCCVEWLWVGESMYVEKNLDGDYNMHVDM